MKTRRIPHTDLTVSCIAYGCAMLAAWDDKIISIEHRKRAESLIRTACDQGITLFDHADVYGFGNSEAVFGDVLRASPGLREKLVIQSKCGQIFSSDWQKWGDAIRVDLSEKHIVRSAEGSLTRLNTDYLDILLLHAPSALVQPEEVARAFDALHKSGKVRYFGVSNHTGAQIQLLKKAVRHPVVVNQIRLGLGHADAFTDGIEFTIELACGTSGGRYLSVAGSSILDYCRFDDIQIQAYSPLRGDLLSPDPDSTPEANAVASILTELAAAKQSTPAAIALAWLSHHPAGIIPIIGATKREHIVDNCGADRVTMTNNEWYDLLSAAAKLKSRVIGV